MTKASAIAAITTLLLAVTAMTQDARQSQTSPAASKSRRSPASAPASGPAADADTSRVQAARPADREIVYKKTPQADLKMFVYLPKDWKAADRRAAIVFFFGGGWAGGSPRQFFSKGEYFASRGLVAVSCEYRVKNVHQTTPAECVEDARSAMRYVRKHAAELGVDGDKLISAGGSAGGHLAACVATTDGPDSPDDDLSVSCRPAAMVLFNPVLDTSDPRAMERMSGATEADKKILARKVSPIEYVQKGCPPGIVFFGTADALLPQGRGFVAKSLALGNRIELWTAEGMPHGFFNGSPWHEATTIAADEFLARLGYLSGPATMKPADPKAVLVKALPAAPQPGAKAATR